MEIGKEATEISKEFHCRSGPVLGTVCLQLLSKEEDGFDYHIVI